jgi:hypothetical protein
MLTSICSCVGLELCRIAVTFGLKTLEKSKRVVGCFGKGLWEQGCYTCARGWQVAESRRASSVGTSKQIAYLDRNRGLV